jgi:hypothetical protein
MKNVRFGLVTLALGALAVCLPARANATTFTLDCLISSSTVGFNGGCQPISPSQGTITYNDATGAGTVDLTGAANGAKTFDLDSLQADGYNIGKFDLDISFKSNLTEPYSFTLLYNGNPVNLGGTTTDGGLLAAAHVGGFAQECSEWLGDSTSNTGGSSGNSGLCGGNGGSNGLSVPEPASMLLFGLGTIGVAARMRRRVSA